MKKFFILNGFVILGMFIDTFTISNFNPRKIISLVPSQTELLWHFGLENETIGITKFCVRPAHWQKSKIIVGGTKQINLARIFELKPDLIICNKEENVKEQIDLLAKEFAVYMTDISTYEQAIHAIKEIGILTNKYNEAKTLTQQIKNSFTSELTNVERIKAAYLIWNKPYMTIGGDTFISDLMHVGGFENVFKNKLRYPITSLEELKEINPPVIMLSSEPYPFSEKHIKEIKQSLPSSKVLLVDGEIFSWYGSRMLYAAKYLKGLHGLI